MEPLRVGVVGVAGIGLAHLFATKTLTDAYRLVAVCDIDAERARKAGTDFEADVHTDLHAFLGSGLDVVVIATPPSFHQDMVGAALDAGAHVYCEKPLAPTVSACEAIASAAAEAGRVVQVGFQYRFRPPYARMHELADGIGRLHRANLTATNWFRPRAYFDVAAWRGGWRTAGGGVLLSQAVHQLDAFLWTAGMPSRVTAHARRRLHPVEVEDDVVAICEWSDGAIGTVSASTADPVGVDRIELHGDEGSLVLSDGVLHRASFDGPASRLWEETTDPFASVDLTWEEVARPEGGPTKQEFDAICACHRDFVAAVTTGSRPLNHPGEASKAVAFANAVYLSALRSAPVDLPVDTSEYDTVFEELAGGRRSLPEVAQMKRNW